MDTTLTAASFKKTTSSKPRDPGAHRRTYLDTYARRRVGLPDKPVATVSHNVQAPTPQVVDISAPQTLQPTAHQMHMPPITSKAIATEAPVMSEFVQKPLPPTATPKQLTMQEVKPVNVPVATEFAEPIAYSPVVDANPAPELATTHRSYLESLAKRHISATEQAPAKEETVFDASLEQETDALFEDAKSSQKLEANLRALYEEPLADQISKNTKSASASHVRTIVASAVACGILAVGIFSFTAGYDATPVTAQPIGAPVIEVEAPVQQPTGGNPIVTERNTVAPEVNPAHPVRLVMSSIGVNAPVEGLGTTPDGLIDVPQAYGVAGWYNKGVMPGQDGPAVLVGHYTAGAGGVFDKLSDVKEGDLVTVSNGHGDSFTYKVTKMAEYHKDQVPMAELFEKGNGSRLEIITCAGKWQANNYDKRLVVTAELVR